ncbi:MAG: ATP synthase subunit I [Alphaproteobacteria bacterium]
MAASFIIAGCFFSGIMVGLLYLCALWHTVKKLPQGDKTKLWFLGNALLRVIMVVVAFYYLSGGDFYNLIALLVGFMVVRYFGTKKIIKKIEKMVAQRKEVALKEVE